MATEGQTQGDPSAAAFFCIGIQPAVSQLCRVAREAGGTGVFGMDDGYIIGPPEVIFPALETFERRLREECGLILQREKSEVLSWDGTLPMEASNGMVLARGLSGPSW